MFNLHTGRKTNCSSRYPDITPYRQRKQILVCDVCVRVDKQQ